MQWPYRSRALCCNLCKYSSHNIYNFRSHVSRCHTYVQRFCALTPCSKCLFIGHPKVVKRHMLFFHSKSPSQTIPPTLPQPHTQPQRDALLPAHPGNERYQCRRCGFPSCSIFTIKKHIILKHLDGLAEQYIGYKLNQCGTATIKIYCCKVCRLNTGTLDQMVHHMLVEPSHYAVNTKVQHMIWENKNYKPTPNGNGVFVTFPSIAPKPNQPQMFKGNPLVLPSNGQPPGTVVALQQLQGATNNTTALICAPGTNQAFLPPQASALVQLASAEAKGLLQPGATIALRSALPQGSPMVQLPAVSNVSLKQAPVTLAPAGVQPQLQIPQTQQIVLPPGIQASVAVGPGAAPNPAVVTQTSSSNQVALQGTMLTSQSLLSHLIPTGNKLNGMPTYTFAPLPVAAPTSQSSNTPLKAVEKSANSSPQTKKWITCPLCNELFPANVFDMHTEVAHQSSDPKSENVAARAAFLKKMPDKTVKCLTCKMLLSEKSVFQHLLHGLNCLHCSALFFSIKQLVEHVKQHNPNTKTYCDFLRQKYKICTKPTGGILFPYFDVHTTAPKEILGEGEVNLALVTSALDLIFFKLQPSNQPEICPAPAKINSSYCPFCDEKFHIEVKHLEHLKQKHFVAPTIHAILKTEAFKCIYCNGVYTGKVTQQAVMLHIQRCRCSPKRQQPTPPPPPPVVPKVTVATLPPPKPAPQVAHPQGLYFIQVPRLAVKQPIAPAPVAQVAPAAEPKETEAEMLSKKRLEAALKEAMEANKREREQRAALRRKREQERLQPPLPPPPPPPPESLVPPDDPSVKLALEPTALERRDTDERRDFINKYFNLNPYASKLETEELCKRLSLSKPDLAGQFSKKRTKCMKTLKRNTAAVLLGFSMAELSKVKHDVVFPEWQSNEAAEQQPASPAQPENGEDGPEPMDESVSEPVTEGEQAEQMK